MLRPILTAALDNALRAGDGALTGPVSRGDAGTVAEHLEALRAHPETGPRTSPSPARPPAAPAPPAGCAPTSPTASPRSSTTRSPRMTEPTVVRTRDELRAARAPLGDDVAVVMTRARCTRATPPSSARPGPRRGTSS